MIEITKESKCEKRYSIRQNRQIVTKEYQLKNEIDMNLIFRLLFNSFFSLIFIAKEKAVFLKNN